MIDLNLPDGELSRQLEIKTEDLGRIDLSMLKPHVHLMHINISMSKIGHIEGGFECPELRTIIMSDNLIREITPFMF